MCSCNVASFCRQRGWQDPNSFSKLLLQTRFWGNQNGVSRMRLVGRTQAGFLANGVFGKRGFWQTGFLALPKPPITSFEAIKWLEVNFPSRGKVINFPSSRKNSFFSIPSFHGKTGHFKGKGKPFSRPNFPLEGKFCLKRCLGQGVLTKMAKTTNVHSVHKNKG